MYKYSSSPSSEPGFILTVASMASAAMPFLIITVPWGGSGCFFLLLAMGLFFLTNYVTNIWCLLQEYPWFTVSILSWCLLISGQMLTTGPVAGRNFELILRFAAGLIIFPLSAFAPTQMLKKIEWGIISGAFSAFIFALLTIDCGYEQINRAGNFFTNAITFGNISLLLGFWSLISLYWDAFNSPLKKVLKFLAFFAAIYASFLSGSRGGWIAIPFFILVLMHITLFKTSIKKRYIIIFTVLCVSVGFCSKNFISNRINSVVTDFKLYKNGILDTSTGERLQLWKASVIIFKNNPIFGVGRGNFKDAVKDLEIQGEVTNKVTSYDHAHNEILFMMAQFGSIGLIALILFYAATIASFYPYLRYRDATIKTAAHMGIILSGGVVIFGFTEVFFDKVKTVGFFIVIISSFAGIIASRQRELGL